MNSGRDQYLIGEKEAAEISTYCAIAGANRSVIRLTEIIQLMSIEATEEDVESAWHHNSALSSRYALDCGYVVERSTPRLDIVREEEDNRKRATRNLLVATEFASLCRDRRVKLLAVSGGNSYQSARQEDDIDFFCVTNEDSLWIFLLRSLLLARIYRLTRRSPPFCFSYVLDERKARKEFHDAKDGLFARDALSALVISGHAYYQALLEDAGWMERYFPKLYRRRMAEEKKEEGPRTRGAGSRTLNAFLYSTVGTYVRLKAWLANERYRRKNNSPAIFRVRVDRDHCIYESNRYVRLRGMYEAAVSRETRNSR